MSLLTSWAKYISGTHYCISHRPEIPGAFSALNQGTVRPFRFISFTRFISQAIMYQGSAQSKSDCQTRDWSFINRLKLCYRLAHNQMWLIEPKDAPTITPGKNDNQNDEVATSLRSGSYDFREEFLPMLYPIWR